MAAIDRMRQRGGFDPTALMLDDGTVVSGPDSASRAQFALEDMDFRRRHADPGFFDRVGNVGNNMGGFFGALAAKDNYARSMGGSSRIDLMGQGPGTGTGWGSWQANVDNGPDVNLDANYATQAMAQAVATAEAARAEQARRAAAERQPYTGIFSQQGVSPEVGGMVDAEEGAADAAGKVGERRAGMRMPATRRIISGRKRPPINRPQAGSYTTPR